MRWRSVPVEAIVWREWGDEFVVRNDRSGSTHLLGPLAGRILKALAEADCGMSIGELAVRLNDEPAPPDTSDWHAVIEAILREFERFGLAEPELR